jgi:D-3-phosphoglycerate dehydrogenase
VRTVVASYLGRIAEHDTRVLTLAILKGILGPSVNEPVSFVNAPMLARDRGVTVSEMRSTVSQDYVSLLSIRAETDVGPVSVEGTIVARNAERITQVNDFDIELAPAARMVFFNYVDRPGIIGKVGTILGDHRINIATMDVGRKPEGQGMEALMCVTVDSEVPAHVLVNIAEAIEAKTIRAVSLPV